MQNIPINLATDGMVLAREILRPEKPESPPICGKGMTLTAGLIEKLKNLGVQSVAVEGHPVALEGDLTLDEAIAALEKRFRKVSDPATLKIRDAYRSYLTKSMKG